MKAAKSKTTFTSEATGRQQTFIAVFTSGNEARVQFAVPPQGRRVRFSVMTTRPMTRQDHADCDRWLKVSGKTPVNWLAVA